jgi:hypothetical protein
MGAGESSPCEPPSSDQQTNYPKECPMNGEKRANYPRECPMHQENQSVPSECPISKTKDDINPANMVHYLIIIYVIMAIYLLCSNHFLVVFTTKQKSLLKYIYL